MKALGVVVFFGAVAVVLGFTSCKKPVESAPTSAWIEWEEYGPPRRESELLEKLEKIEREIIEQRVEIRQEQMALHDWHGEEYTEEGD